MIKTIHKIAKIIHEEEKISLSEWAKMLKVGHIEIQRLLSEDEDFRNGVTLGIMLLKSKLKQKVLDATDGEDNYPVNLPAIKTMLSLLNADDILPAIKDSAPVSINDLLEE
jgi:hypothetical protein